MTESEYCHPLTGLVKFVFFDYPENTCRILEKMQVELFLLSNLLDSQKTELKAYETFERLVVRVESLERARQKFENLLAHLDDRIGILQGFTKSPYSVDEWLQRRILVGDRQFQKSLNHFRETVFPESRTYLSILNTGLNLSEGFLQRMYEDNRYEHVNAVYWYLCEVKNCFSIVHRDHETALTVFKTLRNRLEKRVYI